MYQVFIFLLGHLHIFMHFFFTLMENLFMVHPILSQCFSALILLPGSLVLRLLLLLCLDVAEHKPCTVGPTVP